MLERNRAAAAVLAMFRGFGGENGPEKVEPAFVYYRNEIVSLDVERYAFPGCPSAIVRELPIIIDVRGEEGSAENMQNVCTIVVVGTEDLQACDFVQLLQVVQKGIFDGLRGDVVLQQLVLQLRKEWTLVVAQFWLDPIFGIEKDLPIGLPNAVILSPFLPLIRIDRGCGNADLLRVRVQVALQVHQAALDKELDRGHGLHDA